MKPVEVMARGIAIKRTARAFCSVIAHFDVSGVTVDDGDNQDAEAAMRYLRDAGYAVVPVEPTEAMVDDGLSGLSAYIDSIEQIESCYKAMIEAAPE